MEVPLGMEDPRKKIYLINTQGVQHKLEMDTETTDRGKSVTQPTSKLSPGKIATYEFDEGRDDQGKDLEKYRNLSDDPERIGEDTNPEEKELHRDTIIKCSEGLLKT